MQAFTGKWSEGFRFLLDLFFWEICSSGFRFIYKILAPIISATVSMLYYEIGVVKVSLSNNCTVIIIGVYRPPDKSKIPEFRIKLNEIVASTSQSDHVFIVGYLNINLLDPIAMENDFINNCHSNSLIPLINQPTRNPNNNPSILDHVWTNQL